MTYIHTYRQTDRHTYTHTDRQMEPKYDIDTLRIFCTILNRRSNALISCLTCIYSVFWFMIKYIISVCTILNQRSNALISDKFFYLKVYTEKPVVTKLHIFTPSALRFNALISCLIIIYSFCWFKLKGCLHYVTYLFINSICVSTLWFHAWCVFILLTGFYWNSFLLIF